MYYRMKRRYKNSNKQHGKNCKYRKLNSVSSLRSELSCSQNDNKIQSSDGSSVGSEVSSDYQKSINSNDHSSLLNVSSSKFSISESGKSKISDDNVDLSDSSSIRMSSILNYKKSTIIDDDNSSKRSPSKRSSENSKASSIEVESNNNVCRFVMLKNSYKI